MWSFKSCSRALRFGLRLQNLVPRLGLEFAFEGSGLRQRVRALEGLGCLVVPLDLAGRSVDLLLLVSEAWPLFVWPGCHSP